MIGNIVYVNHQGEKIEFGKNGMFIRESDLLDYTWKAVEENKKLSGFERTIANKTVSIVVKKDTMEEFAESCNRFFEVTEKDVLAEKNGRFVIGDYYLSCYVLEVKKSKYVKNSNYTNVKIKIVSPYPFWCREKTSHFFQKDKKPAVSSDTDEYLYYAYSYPYRYSMPADVGHLQNDHYAACDFKMIIYGPCENPSIRINGHLYEVTVVLYPGEYLVIDSRDNTVIRYLIDGRTDNRFNFRNKENDLFQKIPAGRCAVLWNTAAYGFDVTLFQERSEPQWIL